jgi:hypothetical protein
MRRATWVDDIDFARRAFLTEGLAAVDLWKRFNVRLLADSVAKVVLHWCSKILRAAGAAFV